MYLSTLFAFVTALGGRAAAAPGDCRPLGNSSAPVPTPNTPEAFTSFGYYDEIANSAVSPTGYEAFLVAGHAAVHSDGHYVTYGEFPSYDVGACAKACDGLEGCASFNIYFQRHPSLAPGRACPNPEANVVVRCALFRSAMSAAQATNNGQERGPVDDDGDKFEVLMRGSNGKFVLVVI
ncbi:uncharacterized protein M421DRAFT_408360 [Didymella exigua CBS 183.55]|uniref:Apple domain-containing protein n=1 Tax=Didymella exigua CBS 183.55 TaxID=1150837 RepID=A0A6A5R434_9PLEO|nr:uncharacterized protein M421DRAFT_408360 [Didymella exigua CBS 183.55]KAF1922845.1 hypothetical protein M421DRAFT_408360 [Didymella exigua CBS 183.55]